MPSGFWAAQARTPDGVLAADSLSVRISFPVGKTGYIPELGNNEDRILEFVAMHDSLTADPEIRVKWITIVGSASTEGSKSLNDNLSAKRADQIILQLRQHISLPNSAIHVESRGADWNELGRLVAESDVPGKEEILETIRTVPVEKRNAALKRISGGAAYKYLAEHIFPEIRYSKVMIEYMRPKTEEEILRDTVEVTHRDTVEVVRHDTLRLVRRDTVSVVLRDTVVQVRHDTVVIMAAPQVLPADSGEPVQKRKCGFNVGLKTNLLSDAALIPDVGVEFCLGRKWSLGADWHYAWWANKKAFCWKTYGGDVFVRRWLGKKSDERPLTGHHIGIYGQMNSFDFDAGGNGILSYPYDYGGGVEYGYSIRVANRLNLDFSLGVGYLGGEYKTYTPTMNEYPREMHYVWQSTKSFHWIGPTKLEISLVWILGKLDRKEEQE